MTNPLDPMRRVELRFYYSMMVFYIIFVTMVLVGGGCLLLLGPGGMSIVTARPVLLACLISLIVGTALSAYISDRIFAPLLRLSEASKQVAQGDFSVRVDPETRVNEIRETCENFNFMVQELAGIETLRNDFVANVSHEFKTPITAIEGYAMLLQDQSLTAAEREDCTARILDGTRRLTALVGNILTLSKIENQSVSLVRQSFRLDEQIRQALVNLEPKWSAKNIELDVELELIVYCGVENLLMQAWTNLIDNAVKFSPAGGLIAISSRQEQDRIIVTVEDQGPGISEAALAHIFEKFYQADTSHRAEGNGLGLTLVREIALLHGGGVIAANRSGAAGSAAGSSGAVFTVTLKV